MSCEERGERERERENVYCMFILQQTERDKVRFRDGETAYIYILIKNYNSMAITVEVGASGV